MYEYVSSKLDTEKKSRKSNQTGIPAKMKNRFENASGFSFDDVRVHYNSDKPAAVQAHAYTQGNQVYIAPGQERHLSHELGHVVQQKAGLVHATASINGLPLNDSAALEKQADQLASLTRKATAASASDASVIQCKINEKTNVIFGLNGKAKENIIAALASGYTSFDCGDTYGTSADDLKNAILEYNQGARPLKRDDYDIIYKIGNTYPDEASLIAHLQETADKFEGRIDYAFIHKMTLGSPTEHQMIMNAFSELKSARIITNIGMGDITATELETEAFNAVSCFEMPAIDFILPEKQDVIAKIAESEKPVFVYGIVRLLQDILSLPTQEGAEPSEHEVTSQHIKAFIQYLIGTSNCSIQPILSSRNPTVIDANHSVMTLTENEFAMYRESDSEEYMNIMEIIIGQTPAYSVKKSALPSISSMSVETIRKLGSDKINLFETNWVEDSELFTGTCPAEVLELFSEEELQARYSADTNIVTLHGLLNALYASGNCDRTSAYNMLSVLLAMAL